MKKQLFFTILACLAIDVIIYLVLTGILVFLLFYLGNSQVDQGLVTVILKTLSVFAVPVVAITAHAIILFHTIEGSRRKKLFLWVLLSSPVLILYSFMAQFFLTR